MDDVRLEGKLDALASQMSSVLTQVASTRATVDAHVRQQEERTRRRDVHEADHEARIRTLEQAGVGDHGEQIEQLREEIRQLREWRARLAGVAAAIGAGVGTPLGAVAVVLARALG